MHTPPIVEEKHRVQRLLSAASASISDYLDRNQRAVEELARERNLKWIISDLKPPVRPTFPSDHGDTPAPAPASPPPSQLPEDSRA